MAAIFFQNSAAAAARCRTVPLGNSFSGFQLVALDPECSATVDHYVFAAPRTPPAPYSTMVRGLELNISAWTAAVQPPHPDWINSTILDLTAQLQAQVRNFTDLQASHGPLTAAVSAVESGISSIWQFLSGSGALLAVLATFLGIFACFPRLKAAGAQCLAYRAARALRAARPSVSAPCPVPPPSPSASPERARHPSGEPASPAASTGAVTYSVDPRSSPASSEDAILLPTSPLRPPLLAAPLPRTLSPEEVNALILGQRPTCT